MIHAMQAGGFGRRRPFDPYRYWNTLLLHGDGADASTTFTDDGAKAKTVTAFGDAQIDTSQSALGGASMQFDGTGDYLRIPNGGDFDFGAGDFFVRFRLKCDIASLAVNCAFVGAWGSNQNQWLLYKTGGGAATDSNLTLFLSSNGTAWDVRDGSSGANHTSVNIQSMPAFREIALGRKGNTVGIWDSGVSQATYSVSATLFAGGTYLYVGADYLGSASLLGRIDELQIHNGICLFTPGATYQVPVAPLANAG